MDRKRQDDNEQKQRETEVSPSVPQWRAVQVASRQPQVLAPRVASMPVVKAPPTNSASDDVIDKASFFNAPSENETAKPKAESPWVCGELRPVPAFYPLEKSSRFVEDEKDAVTERLTECLRVLSVQASYNNETASAYLMTSEGVEMHLSLWKTPGEGSGGIVVELQRRKGDSIAFHRYSRYILDAAVGDFNATKHIETHGEDIDFVYSKKVQRLLNVELGKSQATEHENAVIAIEIAHGLIMKDRMDARQLGLESLCLLTDPKKTGITTALITSHVVLLGTARGIEGLTTNTGLEEDVILDEAPFQGIREAILSLVQFGRVGEDVEFEDEDDSETMGALHNLALAVLANALDVIENQERFDKNPEDTEKKPSAIRTASSSSITGTFLEEGNEISKTEILSTLIAELGKASQKPHDAHLSARCIGSLCRASEKAKRRAKELGAKNVVSTALDVGTRTHLKLETECNKVTKVLNAVAQDEEN